MTTPSPPPFDNKGISDEDQKDLFRPPNLNQLKQDLFLSDSDSDSEEPQNTDNSKSTIETEWLNAIQLVQSTTKELVHLEKEHLNKKNLEKLHKITQDLVDLVLSINFE